MDILEMTDLEIYDLGIKKLTEQMGTTYAARFLQKYKPRDYDYTAERHKWLADGPDIPTMVEQIQEARALQAEEERIKAERITAWQNGLLELTDLEIYEHGLKVLADGLGAYGLLRFITQHFKHLNSDQSIDQPQPQSGKDVRLGRTEQMPTAEPRD